MLNKEIPEENKMIEKSLKYIEGNHGISFCLVMRNEDGSLSFYKRSNQPCYGELRKYLKSHGDKYTDPQPHDSYRPSDLHDPFPDGTPEAVGIPKGVMRNFHRDMLHPMSPYPLGDNSSIIIKDTGFILLDTKIDPTVMVQMFNAMRSIDFGFYDSAMEAGLTIKQAFALVSNFQNFNHPNFQIGYYHSPCMDFWRVENKSPNDLTGGSFYDRYDYNRKRLHDVWGVLDEEGEKINHFSEFSKIKSGDKNSWFAEFQDYYQAMVLKQKKERE